jgi:hypothetical protein
VFYEEEVVDGEKLYSKNHLPTRDQMFKLIAKIMKKGNESE